MKVSKGLWSDYFSFKKDDLLLIFIFFIFTILQFLSLLEGAFPITCVAWPLVNGTHSGFQYVALVINHS